MSVAVTAADLRSALRPPASYTEMANALVMRRPELFATSCAPVRFVVEARSPQVQAAAGGRDRPRPRRRGGRQLSLPLHPGPPAKLR